MADKLNGAEAALTLFAYARRLRRGVVRSYEGAVFLSLRLPSVRRQNQVLVLPFLPGSKLYETSKLVYGP